jgi:hypothetical protein
MHLGSVEQPVMHLGSVEESAIYLGTVEQPVIYFGTVERLAFPKPYNLVSDTGVVKQTMTSHVFVKKAMTCCESVNWPVVVVNSMVPDDCVAQTIVVFVNLFP